MLAALALCGGAAAFWFTLAMPDAADAPECKAIEASEAEIAANLARHVEHLAVAIGPRSAAVPGTLEAAARYIERQLAASGWRTAREPVGPKGEFANVVAEPAPTVPGAAAARAPAAQLLVIGAHYDTVRRSPGADDNASGVAALIEIARLLALAPSGVATRLVAFTNEEAPLGRSELRGSRVAAAGSRDRGEPLLGMISLESIGYFSDEPGSQRHPKPFGLLFPNTANYIAFIADSASRPFLHRFLAAFRATASLPSEGAVVLPALVPHSRRSDHASYWDRGYPAILITGTADFRNPHYHEPTDLPATLDFARTSQVTLGVASAARCITSETAR